MYHLRDIPPVTIARGKREKSSPTSRLIFEVSKPNISESPSTRPDFPREEITIILARPNRTSRHVLAHLHRRGLCRRGLGRPPLRQRCASLRDPLLVGGRIAAKRKEKRKQPILRKRFASRPDRPLFARSSPALRPLSVWLRPRICRCGSGTGLDRRGQGPHRLGGAFLRQAVWHQPRCVANIPSWHTQCLQLRPGPRAQPPPKIAVHAQHRQADPAPHLRAARAVSQPPACSALHTATYTLITPPPFARAVAWVCVWVDRWAQATRPGRSSRTSPRASPWTTTACRARRCPSGPARS